MKAYSMPDQRYLLVVHGYSLGSIIALLERLDAFIRTENGEKSEILSISKGNFFYDSGPCAFDETVKAFRYWLEDPIIEIVHEILNFTAKEPAWDSWWRYVSCEIITMDWQQQTQRTKTNLADFFERREDDFIGLTLDEWNNILAELVEKVCRKIEIFIPDFDFDLTQLKFEKVHDMSLADGIKVIRS